MTEEKKAILAKHLGKLRNKYEKNVTWDVRCDICHTGICHSGICISCLEAEELLDNILTAHTEPEDERKRFPKGKPSSMEDIFMEYPHTEPEDEHYKLFKHDGSSAKVIKTAKDEVLDACKVCGEPYWRQQEASE